MTTTSYNDIENNSSIEQNRELSSSSSSTPTPTPTTSTSTTTTTTTTFFNPQLSSIIKSIDKNLEIQPNLTVNSWRTLENNNWLNDEVINTYLILMKKQLYHNYDLVVVPSLVYGFLTGSVDKSSSVQRWIMKNEPKILKSLEIYVPIHSNYNHWCLVVINFEKQEIILFDSLNHSSSTTTTTTIFSNVQKLLMLSATTVIEQQQIKSLKLISRVDIPQQLNTNDCGVFTLEYARRMMTGHSITFPNNNNYILKIRKRIMVELIIGKLIRERTEVEIENLLIKALNKLKY